MIWSKRSKTLRIYWADLWVMEWPLVLTNRTVLTKVNTGYTALNCYASMLGINPPNTVYILTWSRSLFI